MSAIRELISRFYKLKLRIILFIFSIFFIIVFLLGGSYISYKVASNIILDKIEKIDESNLKQINNKLTYSVGEIERFVNSIRNNELLVQNVMEYTSNEKSIIGKVNLEKSISFLLMEKQIVHYNISNIQIYTINGNISSSVKNSHINYEQLKASDIYKRVISSKDGITIIEPYFFEKSLKTSSNDLVFCTRICSGDKEIGILLVEMHPGWINDLFGNKSNIIISDKESDSIVWSWDSNKEFGNNGFSQFLQYNHGIFNYSINKTKYKIFYTKTGINNWVSVLCKNMDNMSDQIKNVQSNFILSFIASILLSFIIAIFYSSIITKPIHKLVDIVKKYKVSEKLNYSGKINRRPSIRSSMILYFIIIISIPMIINSVIQYYTLSKVIKDVIFESVMFTVNQTIQNTDYFIQINERVSQNIMLNSNVQNFLMKIDNKTDNKLSTENLNDLNNLKSTIDENMLLGENIFEICLYNISGEPVFSTTFYKQDKFDNTFLAKIKKTSGIPVWTFAGKDRYNRNTIKLIRKINGKDNTDFLTTIGYIFMTYYEINFEELYRDINFKDSSFYIVDDSGVIISHKSKELIGQKTDNIPLSSGITSEYRNRMQVFFVNKKCSYIPWTFIGEIPYNSISNENIQVLLVNFYILIIGIIIIPFLSYIISLHITSSMEKLTHNLIKFGEGYLSIDFTGDLYVSEIEELGKAFNNMSNRIRTLIEQECNSQIREKELQNEKRDAELIALQAQINPHFLLNTFESVICMIKERNNTDAVKILSALGDLFRLGIRDVNNLFTIEEEIVHAKAYIDIQKLRLGSKLKVNWMINKKIILCKTPKLILQPLIENAIYHGIQQNENGGVINIHCYEENGTVLFKVIDDGPGINKETIEEIKTIMNGKLQGNSIGIYNIQKRIQLFFGTGYGISIHSRTGTGTFVTVTLPKIE